MIELIRLFQEERIMRPIETINELKAMTEMRVRLNKIKSQVKILADLKLWNANVYARIGEIMIKVQVILDSRIKIETKV